MGVGPCPMVRATLSQAVEKATQRLLRGGQPARHQRGHHPRHPLSSLEPPPLPPGLEQQCAQSPLPRHGLRLASKVGCPRGTEPLIGGSDSDPSRRCQSSWPGRRPARPAENRGRAYVASGWGLSGQLRHECWGGTPVFSGHDTQALRAPCGPARIGDDGTAHRGTRGGRHLSHG